MIHLDYVWLFKIYENKDENGHGFALSVIRGELLEREREKGKVRERATNNK